MTNSSNKTQDNFLKSMLQTKSKISVRIPQYLHEDIKDYSTITNENTTDIVTLALMEFFKDKTVRNDYLTNVGGLYFNVPANSSLKQYVIDERVILNDVDKTEIDHSEDYISIKVHKIPNNLDILVNNDYRSTKKNVNHAGIEIFIYKDFFNKLDIYSLLDIDFRECLYCFYFEVVGNNRSRVKLINPVNVVNEFSQVNNNKSIEKIVELLEQLDNLSKIFKKNISIDVQQMEQENHNYISNENAKSLTEKYCKLILNELAKLCDVFNTGMVGVSRFDKSISYSIDRFKKG